MKVYKLKLSGDSTVYWLTEELALPILNGWESGKRGPFTIPAYNLMVDYSRIREIRQVEESEPYPDEFKQMLIKGGKLLPTPESTIPEYIKNLPTSTLFLDENLKIIPVSLQSQIKKAWLADHSRYATYYQASCHYKEGEKGKEFYLDRNLIKELLGLRFDPEYPEYEPRVYSRLVYGVERLVY